MSATHTPGPWYAIEYAGMWGIQSVDEYSQDNNLLDMENDDRAEANAKLIAAAPDLLEALVKLTSNKHIDLGDLIYNVKEREGEGWEGPSVKAWGEAVELAKTAIKKATE